MIQQFIYIIQITLAVLLVLVIIIQQKGTGLGNTFGGEFSFYRTKRGAERLLFYITVGLSIAFIASSILGLIVK